MVPIVMRNNKSLDHRTVSFKQSDITRNRFIKETDYTKFHPASGQDNFWCKVHPSGALLVYSDWCKMKEQYERDFGQETKDRKQK